MFERFTQDARSAVVRARAEAVGAGQDHIGCEHLLISLIGGRGPAAQALTAAGLEITSLRAGAPGQPGAGPKPLDAEALATLGIDLDAVRRATDAAFGPGALDRASSGRRGALGAARRMSLDADAKKSLELALRSTTRFRQPGISSGHLLIGLIDQGDNVALDMLVAAGADPAALRADVIARLTAAA